MGEMKLGPTAKKRLFLLLKILFVVGCYGLIFGKILGRDGASDFGSHVANLNWAWIVAGIGMQLTAVCFAVLRWKTLLKGQGIFPRWRFMFGSLLIARFFGAFTPGGFTGFGGWRIWDIHQHTGKTARAAATIGVETILGQMAMGITVILGALLFGHQVIGATGVAVLVGFFTAIITVGILVLTKPAVFRRLLRFLPSAFQSRLHTLVDAVCAYEGKGKLLAQAFALGVGVHVFNSLIYVCTAQGLDVSLSVGVVFFGVTITILATILPVSINGLGLREMTAVAVFSSEAVGLEESLAVALMFCGFALCEMVVSSAGGLLLLARRRGYSPEIRVEDIEREAKVHADIKLVPREAQPRPLRALVIGLGAGAFAGLMIGLTEAAVVIASANGGVGYGVLAYGAIAYGIFCSLGAGAMLFVFAWIGRFMKREAMPEHSVYAATTAFFVGVFGFALTAFRIRRDVFQEELVWKSLPGLGLLIACLIGAALVGGALYFGLRWLVGKTPGRVMLRSWGSPAVVGTVVGGFALVTFLIGEPAAGQVPQREANAPDEAGNVLFIVVDTLRADHLPAYGYDEGSTPNLDAFAEDAIRFRMAFANASWTRPSFASILTGRLPSNHGVMAKPAALADELETLPEVLRGAGYQTRGIATNYNVAPYYNFHQGFDEYRYLEPEYVLGANDAAAKLLLVQTLKRVVEVGYAKLEIVEPGHAYRDAEEVNRNVAEWLDSQSNDRPWFYFVGYMDPHDPYYEHPYNGSGYSRAAHQRPDPSEAERLRGLYNGEITYWDEQFGNLIADLKRRGIYDDLTIVITADHGEEFCEHGGFWHGTTLYDEQLRVPLFVKLAGNRRGGTAVGHWVQSIDLMPSVLRMMGIEIPEGVQGGDIFNGSDVVYAEESHEGNVLEAVRQRRGTDEWKLIVANAGNPRELEPRELYRVDLDPEESRNLNESEAEAGQALDAALERERNRASEGAVDAVIMELTDEDIEQKCRLGYWSAEACCERGFSQYCD